MCYVIYYNNKTITHTLKMECSREAMRELEEDDDDDCAVKIFEMVFYSSANYNR